MKTGTVSWFLRAYWTRICIVALLNLAWGFYLLTPSRWSSSSRFEQPSVIQPSFTFNPPSIRRPFAKRAVVTLFAANESKREFDTSFADVIVLAHTFMLQKRIDVEFVVAVTGFLGFQKRKSLITSGSRLLYLPELIPNSGTSCSSCFSKLLLFGLEGIYDEVLFLESNSILIGDIANLFQYSYSIPNFFGTVKTVEGSLDSSLMLFKPSLRLMNRLVAQIPRFINSSSLERGLLYEYFQRAGQRKWIKLPSNIILNNVTDESYGLALIFRHDFWNDPNIVLPDSNLSYIQRIWKSAVHSIHHTQKLQTGRSDVAIIPSNHTEFQIMLQSNTWTSRIVIYTLITNTTWWDPSTTRVLSNRDRYCIKWGCEQYFQTESRASHPVWQKAFDAKELVEMYDWIWLLDATDAFIMNGDIDLRVLLGNLILEVGHDHADIVISRDWNGFNAGSFFLRSSDWTRQVFIPRWIQDEKRDLYYREQGSISQMWKNDEIGIRRHLVDLEYERSTLINSYYFGKVGNVRNWYQKGHFVLHAPGNRGIVKWLMENNQTEY